MVRTAVIVFLAILLLAPSFSQGTVGADQAMTVHFDLGFHRPEVDLESQERQFTVQGAELDTRPGVPSLPLRTVMLALPYGTTVRDVVVKHSEPRVLEIVERYPKNPLEQTLDGLEGVAATYDGRAWELAGTHVLEGVHIVCINLRPLQWQEGTGKLYSVLDFSIEVNLQDAPLSYRGDMDRVREVVDNPLEVQDGASYPLSDLLPSGTYDYLVITDETLVDPFQELARWKTERNGQGSWHQNIRSVLVTVQEIMAEPAFWGDPASHMGSGNDTQTIVRNFIKAAYEEWGVRYVLLGGDDEIIPVRKMFTALSSILIPGDVYYTGLDGNWDQDNDGVYGEPYRVFEGGPGALGEEADLLAEVFVGRATVSNAAEAWNFVNKTVRYERGYVKEYSKDLLFVGNYLDARPTYGDAYKKEVYNEVLADEGLSLVTLYEGEGNFSDAAFLNWMGSGVHVINHMGHGDYTGFADLSISEVRGLQNELPFVLYTQACNVAGFDERSGNPGDCIAEEFVKGPGGAVAFIGNSRSGWYMPGGTGGTSQKFDISFFSQVYDDGVTELGRALSLSKQEWVGQSASDDYIRWVYMELNLLGDPETRVLTRSLGDHDLSVVEVRAERSVMGEPSVVSVRVQNLGQNQTTGSVALEVEGWKANEVPLTLSPGQSRWVNLTWIPTEHRPYNLSAVSFCSEDENPGNDRMDLASVVDRRLISDEHWDLDRELLGGLIVDPGATLWISDCDVTFRDIGHAYRITVLGGMMVENASFGNASYVIDSLGGWVSFRDAILTDFAESGPSTFTGGRLDMQRTAVIGGPGWMIEGAALNMTDCSLPGPTSEWLIDDCAMIMDGITGTGGSGIRCLDSMGILSNTTWSGGEQGLMIERCPGLSLENISLVGNLIDVGLFGDGPHHFPLDVSNVNLTWGELRVVAGLNGATVEEAAGSLYLIGCQDVLVKGSRFQNASNGLALIDCQGMEVMGNAMENCSVGLLSLESTGLVWSNDLLNNTVQAQGAGMTYGKDYPAGGNHWSDLEGTDELSGPSQDLPGADGIVDVPYSFDGVYDRYPKAQRCSLVHDRLWANISMSAGTANRAEPIILRSAGSSGSGIANWTWEMGDGTVAYGPEVSHTYASLGTVLISLTVRDHRGLEDTCERTLDVLNLLPECLFSYGPSQPDPGEVVSFSDLSSDLDGHIVTWSWSFGDGGASIERSPHHAFAAIGDYTVSLTVVDQDGGSDTRVRKVPVGNQAPVANFSFSPTTVSTLQDVTFISASYDVDGTIASMIWNFGDGTSGEGSQVRHRYSSMGSFTVRMTVMDDDGASSSATAVVSVVNSRPVATFSSPTEVLSLTAVQFQDRSFDPDGKIRSWNWDFGDGNSSSSSSPVHTYMRPGTYSVTLTVTDNLMASSTTVRDLKVLNRLPELTMTAPPGEHRSLERLEFEAAASDEDGEVVRIEWAMGDGNVLVGSSIVHAYAAPGNYTLVLTCTDDAGGMASIETRVLINNLQPLAAMRAEQSAEHPLELMFLSDSSDPDGRIAGINWSFGDGSFAEGDAVVHRYDHAGQYEVRLTVIDDAGGMAETSSLVTVRQVNVSLYGPHLVHDEVWGWRLIAGIVNDGAVPLNITIIVTAGGNDYVNEHTVEGGSLLDLDGIWLEGLDEGEVRVRLLVPEGWDADLSDNTWTGTASLDDPLPIWVMGAGAVLVAAVAMVLLLRRKG